MVESSPPQVKHEDQYPLLMVAVGAGDATAPRAPPPIPHQLWSTSVLPGRRWRGNWREYISTCLMTCVLFTIAFLIFYGIAMVMVQRPGGYGVVKRNDTSSTKEVFYHFITSSKENDLFKSHSDYLSNMAWKYPLLKFRIYILINNFDQNTPTMYEKMTGNICNKYNLRNRREIGFLLKHRNINISIMTLAKFMAMTPLKIKWKDIPIEYIPFYARIFSVWLYGGVGLDLGTLDGKDAFSSSYLIRKNRKVKSILIEHSKGIYAENYKETLMKLAADDGTDMPASLFNMVQKIFNQTLSILNTSFGISSLLKRDADPVQFLPLVRTHRDKRELSTEKTSSVDSNYTVTYIMLTNTSTLNETGQEYKENFYNIHSDNDTEKNYKDEKNTSVITDPLADISNAIARMFNMDGVLSKADKEKSNETEIIFFYDVSVIPKPLYFMEASPIRHVENIHVPRSTEMKNKVISQGFVAIDAEGAYVASTTSMHYFLGRVLLAGCKSLSPKDAIKNALTFCTGYYRNDPYCNSVYLL